MKVRTDVIRLTTGLVIVFDETSWVHVPHTVPLGVEMRPGIRHKDQLLYDVVVRVNQRKVFEDRNLTFDEAKFMADALRRQFFLHEPKISYSG